jgi:hypothetical protein
MTYLPIFACPRFDDDCTVEAPVIEREFVDRLT